jgi:hypothetical protein
MPAGESHMLWLMPLLPGSASCIPTTMVDIALDFRSSARRPRIQAICSRSKALSEALSSERKSTEPFMTQ